MNSYAEKINDERDFLTKNEAMSLLWEWRKYRNMMVWETMYKWGAAALILTILPYLMPDLINKLRYAVFVFPVLAFLLTVFAAWLMAAEYIRFVAVNRKYRHLLGEFDPDDTHSNKLIDRIFGVSLGKIVVMFFLFFAVFIELANVLILLSLVRNSLN